MMKRVCVICEGQTEETFVEQVLAPSFYDLGLSLTGQTIQTSPGKKGGALNYARIKRDIDGIVSVNKSWLGASEELKIIKAKAQSPEYINNKPETKPAAHLEKLLLSPKYKKVAHGSIAMKNIGLSAMERECEFFSEWVSSIRRLAK